MLYCSELKERRGDVKENREMRNDGNWKMWKNRKHVEVEAGNKETEEKKD